MPVRKCKTPGARYSIAVHAGSKSVNVFISLPEVIVLTDKQTKDLKRRLHDGVEKALADTFKFGWCRRLGRSPFFIRAMLPIEEADED